MKSMKLGYGVVRSDDPRNETFDYKVLVIKNSIAYVPGQVLEKVEVDDLCQSRHWDITIVALDQGGKS